MSAAAAVSWPSVARPWWERYIGLPFGDQPGEVTCWGLVVEIYRRELGIELPLYGEISARDLIRVAQAMRHGDRVEDGWRVVAPPQAFDVVAMSGPTGGVSVVHVGVMVDSRRILHVEEATDAIIVPLTHWSVAGRIRGYRRRLP